MATLVTPDELNISGKVTDFSNTGTGGGTGHYVNIGGLKLAWGVTSQTSSITAGGTLNWGVTLPAFFTTIQSAGGTLSGLTGSARQLVYQASDPTTSALSFAILNFDASSSVTGKIFWWVIGI